MRLLTLAFVFVILASTAFAGSPPHSMSGTPGLRLGMRSALELASLISALKGNTSTRAGRDAVAHDREQLELEQRGAKVVGLYLAKLDEIGERHGLEAKNFALTSDIGDDFWYEPSVKSMEQAYMFTFLGWQDPVIYINTRTDLFEGTVREDPDWVLFGATVVAHEATHLMGTNGESRSEHAAFAAQLRLLDSLGSSAFHSHSFFNRMRKFLVKGTALSY